MIVLGEDEALLLRAKSDFFEEVEGSKVLRKAGSVWMKNGPCDYIPRIEVEKLQTLKNFPLDRNEGIYVRDKRTGEVKMIKG